MKANIEENNQEVEVIEAEGLEEMKLRLYSIEEKVCKTTANNKEIQFVIDLIGNTVDYSDLLATPDFERETFTAKTDYQALGQLVGDFLNLRRRSLFSTLKRHFSVVTTYSK